MKTMKLDNHIYDDNKVVDKNENIIFQGNFEETCKFVLDKFNETLPLDLDIEKFEDFNGREFKVELGIIIPDEMLNFFKDREIREEKLFNLYNELFGNLSIKNILNFIEKKEILNYKNKYDEFNFSDEDFIDEVKYQLFSKYVNKGIKVKFSPQLKVDEDSFIFTTDLFFIEEDEGIYIFEQVQGQGTLNYIYNIKDNKDFSIETWKNIIEYSKELDLLNKKYSIIFGGKEDESN
jgi:hypothetical protein